MCDKQPIKQTINDCFAIPVGEEWGHSPQSVWLLYAPLSGKISLSENPSIENFVFDAQGEVPVYRIPVSPHDLWQIDLLTNYTCNFKCIYCYSAKGRSSKQVEWQHIKGVIDYLFLSQKKQINPYVINFSGGGEPLMSFDLIRRTIEYIEQVNRGHNYQYSIGLVTNGSLITPSIVDYLECKHIDMAVSFEILKALQNKERGSYAKVAANIDMMSERGYPFGIRTTFTPESVHYMTEMIEEVHRRFPKLKRVVYDVVLAPSLFKSPNELRSYYDAFLKGFYAAKDLGTTKGIKVESVAVELLSVVRERTCNGKIVLTPVGSISTCARVSSPQEEHYNDYTIGEVKDGKVVMDDAKYKRIMNEYNIYSQTKCEKCYAKWNCGGGCRLFHQAFNETYDEVRCDFVRKALKRELLRTLSSMFNQSTGKDLYTFVQRKLITANE